MIQYVFAPGVLPVARWDIDGQGQPAAIYEPVTVCNAFGHTRMMQPVKDLGRGRWLMSSQGETFIVHPAHEAWKPNGEEESTKEGSEAESEPAD